MSAPVSYGIRHLAPLTPGFLQQHADISIELSFSDQIVDLISGTFDLAVRIGSSDSSLRVRRLCAIRRRLVAAPSYLARHGRPQHPRDLANLECPRSCQSGLTP